MQRGRCGCAEVWVWERCECAEVWVWERYECAEVWACRGGSCGFGDVDMEWWAGYLEAAVCGDCLCDCLYSMLHKCKRLK